MSRNREFDEAAALKAIEEMFWENGYEGTSYADLMSATGLGKGSLYAAFGNKDALYLKSLASYIQREVDSAVQLLCGKKESLSLSAKTRIGKFLDQAIKPVEQRKDRRGCFLCNAASDLAPHNKDVELEVLGAIDQIRNALESVLKNSHEASSRKLAKEHVLCVYFGMRAMAKSGTSVARLKLMRDAVLQNL